MTNAQALELLTRAVDLAYDHDQNQPPDDGFSMALEHIAARLRGDGEQGQAVAYWLAVDPEGTVHYGLTTNDANGGAVARQLVNDWINETDARQRIVGVYDRPQPVAGDAVLALRELRDEALRGSFADTLSGDHDAVKRMLRRIADQCDAALSTQPAPSASPRSLYDFEDDPLPAPSEQVAAPVAVVPEGYALVPVQMALAPEDVENFLAQVTNDPDAEDVDDRYAGATLVVGRIALDGEETDADATGPYGLHVFNPDYPDEGCVTLVEFAAAPQPAAEPNLTGAAPDGATEAGAIVQDGGKG